MVTGTADGTAGADREGRRDLGRHAVEAVLVEVEPMLLKRLVRVDGRPPFVVSRGELRLQLRHPDQRSQAALEDLHALASLGRSGSGGACGINVLGRRGHRIRKFGDPALQRLDPALEPGPALVQDDEVGRQRGHFCLDRLHGPRRGDRLSGIV